MTTLKAIDAKLRLIAASGEKFNAHVHQACIMIATHAKEHGDCTRALALCFAMPASVRRTMVVQWFDTYTPIRVVIKNDKVGMLKETQKGFTPFDLEAGNATPWHKLAEDSPEEKMLDFAALCKLVEALGKRIEKKIEDGKVPPEDVESAKAIARNVAGLKLVRVEPKPANDEGAEQLKGVA